MIILRDFINNGNEIKKIFKFLMPQNVKDAVSICKQVKINDKTIKYELNSIKINKCCELLTGIDLRLSNKISAQEKIIKLNGFKEVLKDLIAYKNAINKYKEYIDTNFKNEISIRDIATTITVSQNIYDFRIKIRAIKDVTQNTDIEIDESMSPVNLTQAMEEILDALKKLKQFEDIFVKYKMYAISITNSLDSILKFGLDEIDQMCDCLQNAKPKEQVDNFFLIIRK